MDIYFPSRFKYYRKHDTASLRGDVNATMPRYKGGEESGKNHPGMITNNGHGRQTTDGYVDIT